jgi:hypothetical protein
VAIPIRKWAIGVALLVLGLMTIVLIVDLSADPWRISQIASLKQ